MKRVLLCVSASAVLGLSFIVGRHSSEPAACPCGKLSSEPVEAGLRKLEREFAASRQELATLKTLVARASEEVTRSRSSQAAPAAPAQPLDEAEAPLTDDEPVTQPAARSPAQLAAEYDLRLSSEGIDLAWSRDQTRALRETIAAAAKTTKVVDLECATSLCRVSVSHEDDQAQREFARAIADQAPFRAGVYYVYDRDQVPPSTTLYVMRAQHSG